MMPPLLATTSPAAAGTEPGAAGSKDPDEKLKEDFVSMLASLCSTTPVPPVTISNAELTQGATAPALPAQNEQPGLLQVTASLYFSGRISPTFEPGSEQSRTSDLPFGEPTGWAGPVQETNANGISVEQPVVPGMASLTPDALPPTASAIVSSPELISPPATGAEKTAAPVVNQVAEITTAELLAPAKPASNEMTGSLRQSAEALSARSSAPGMATSNSPLGTNRELLETPPPALKVLNTSPLIASPAVAPNATTTLQAHLSAGQPLSNKTDSARPVIAIDSAQTLQDQAAQRDADLVAGQLAEASRAHRESNPLLAIRKQFGTDAGLNNQKEEPEPSPVVIDGTTTLAKSGLPFSAIEEDLTSEETTKSIAAQASDRIVAIAETLSVRQIRSIRLHLKPEALGRVEIQIKRDAEGKISVYLTAQRETSRQSLSQSMDQLRQTLERAGVNVNQLHVKAETGGYRSYRNHENPQSQNRRPHSINSRSQTTDLVTEESGANGVRIDKLLSLSA